MASSGIGAASVPMTITDKMAKIEKRMTFVSFIKVGGRRKIAMGLSMEGGCHQKRS